MSDSQAPITKVPFDPGWNDPPPLSFSPQAQPSKPRNILNKRVGFPLSSQLPPAAFPSSGPSLATVPPVPVVMPLPVPPLPVAIQPPGPPTHNYNSVTPDMDSESTLSEVLDILNGVIDSSSELGNKALDIKKRISIMENTWRSGKLSNNVQYKMWQLATAVKEERPREADELHKALMVEHVGEVSAWMPAVRRLLHHNIARHDLLAIDKEEEDIAHL